ncbi:MAG TPA: MoaD/ThiS family protein [Pirellulales bacterium]|nr:MoaD/ThiS family protein [Pirellulales bacterium]
MNARVQMFARAKELAGRDFVELTLPDGATVTDLRRALAEAVPGMAPLLPHVMIAVNLEYASDGAKIPEAVALACIPPVSGG